MPGRDSEAPLATVVSDTDFLGGTDTSDTSEALSGTTKRWPMLLLKTYFQSGLSGGGGGAPLFIVASNTAHATIKARADIVCDGVADQVEINTYLALGSVQLTDGDYFLTAPITVTKPGHSLRGMGQGHDQGANGGRGFGTILYMTSGFTGAAGVVVDQAGTYIVGLVNVSGFKIDATALVTGTADGIRVKSFQGTVENLFVETPRRHGIVIEGNDVGDASWDSYDLRVAKCIVARSQTGSGLYLDRAASDIHVSECIFLHNETGGGIEFGGGGVSGQYTDVHCYSNRYGVWSHNGFGTRSKFVNMKIEHSFRHGVFMDGAAGAGNIAWSQWIGCGFNANGEETHNTYDHINITGASAATKTQFINCQFGNSDSPVNLARYAINIGTAGTGCLIADCYFGWPDGNLGNAGVATGMINIGNAATRNVTTITGCVGADGWHGTGNTVGAVAGSNAGTSPPSPVVAGDSTDTCGRITFGTGTTPAAGNMAVVTFVRAKAPVAHRIMLTPSNSAAALLDIYVASVSTTGFTIACAVAPGASQANTIYSVDYLVGG